MLIHPPRWRSPYTVAAVCRAGVQASSLLGMLFAVAHLAPSTFGAFSVAWITAVIANSLVYSGFYEHLLRVTDAEGAKHSVFWMLLAQGAVSSLVMLAGGLIAGSDGNHDAQLCFYALLPIPMLTAFTAWCDALLTRAGHAATVGAGIFFAELSGAVVLATGLQLGWGIGALIAWRLGSSTAAPLALALFVDGFPRLRATRLAIVEAWKQALPLQGGTLLSSLSVYAADLLLAWHFSPTASASYRAAARVAGTGGDVFLQPLRPMTWAAMAHSERSGDRAGIGRIYLDQLKMVSFFAWPTLVGVAVFSSRIFTALSKADWSESGPLLCLLALARLFGIFSFFFAPVLVCFGLAPGLLRMQTMITVLSLGTLALVSLYGPVAVAVTELALCVLTALFITGYVAHLTRVRVHQIFSAIVPGLIAAALCVGAGELVFRIVPWPDPYRLLISVAAMGLTLLACFGILRAPLSIRLPRGGVVEQASV